MEFKDSPLTPFFPLVNHSKFVKYAILVEK